MDDNKRNNKELNDLCEKKLSTGEPSTLGVYEKYSTIVFGPQSPATQMLRNLIKQAPSGRDSCLGHDEKEFVTFLIGVHTGKISMDNVDVTVTMIPEDDKAPAKEQTLSYDKLKKLSDDPAFRHIKTPMERWTNPLFLLKAIAATLYKVIAIIILSLIGGRKK